MFTFSCSDSLPYVSGQRHLWQQLQKLAAFTGPPTDQTDIVQCMDVAQHDEDGVEGLGFTLKNQQHTLELAMV
jgi:hypothetical protein